MNSVVHDYNNPSLKMSLTSRVQQIQQQHQQQQQNYKQQQQLQQQQQQMQMSHSNAPLPGSSSKQYKYWIDVTDLISLIRDTHNKYQEAPLCMSQDTTDSVSQNQSFVSNKKKQQLHQEQQQKQKQKLKEQPPVDNNVLSDQDQLLAEQIAGDDTEMVYLMQCVQRLFKVSLTDYLQLAATINGGGGGKRTYYVENQKVITQVYLEQQKEDICKSFTDMIQRLLQYQTKFQNKTLRLCFSSQMELYAIFLKIFGSEQMRIISTRKILSEIWESCKLFRLIANTLPTPQLHAYFYFKIQVYAKGRALFSTTDTDFPLHQAVFDNNLPQISRLISCKNDNVFYCEKNSLDSCGNTPLQLAVKLQYTDAVKVLCDLFTCPKLKPFTNYPCALDIATSIKNKHILKILLEANQKLKQHYLDLHKESIFRALESLPDFSIDMHFNCKSNFIPFVRNITPSDTYKIYKQGSQIRLDMTLIGFRKFKCIRGNISVLFKGRGQQNEGELFVVDHDLKSVSNIFSDIAQTKIDKDMDDILVGEQQQYNQKLFRAEKFKIEAELDKKGEVREKLIESAWLAQKYQVKTTFSMTKFKFNVTELDNLTKFKTFQEYLANSSSNLDLENGDHNNENKDAIGGGGDECSSSQYLNTQTATSNHRGDYQLNVFTNNTMMGCQTTNQKTTKKIISASIWLSQEHPLSLDSFLPLLHVLSFSSKQIAKFKDYIVKYKLPRGAFPLKAKVPLFLTMKAAFSLQNLSFDTSHFKDNLFTIDEEYMKQRVINNMNMQLIQQQRMFDLVNVPSPDMASQTLKEIYKLCKTNEDYEDEQDEDSESLDRANELFNSILKRQASNMGEEDEEQLLLVEMSSFHSEYDSIDLSEKVYGTIGGGGGVYLQDPNGGSDVFKLQSHAFTQIQTMKQINGRHDLEDLIQGRVQTSKNLIQEYRNLSYQHRKNRKSKASLSKQQQQQVANIEGSVKESTSLLSGNVNQTLGGENINESKITVPIPVINTTHSKQQIHSRDKPPHGAFQLPGANAETAKTLKKNFQPRSLKNYKNLIQYGSNQIIDVNNNGTTTIHQFNNKTAGGSGNVNHPNDQSVNSMSNDRQGNTPPTSTADTSIITNNKISQFFVSSNLNKAKNTNETSAAVLDTSSTNPGANVIAPSSNNNNNNQYQLHNWLKQLLNPRGQLNKGPETAATGNKGAVGGGNYLQTIESEEILATETCYGGNAGGACDSVLFGSSMNNNVDILDQSNLDDAFQRKSFGQKIINNQVINQHIVGSSRDSSVRSFNSGGNNVANKKNVAINSYIGGIKPNSSSYTQQNQYKSSIEDNSAIKTNPSGGEQLFYKRNSQLCKSSQGTASQSKTAQAIVSNNSELIVGGAASNNNNNNLANARGSNSSSNGVADINREEIKAQNDSNGSGGAGTLNLNGKSVMARFSNYVNNQQELFSRQSFQQQQQQQQQIQHQNSAPQAKYQQKNPYQQQNHYSNNNNSNNSQGKYQVAQTSVTPSKLISKSPYQVHQQLTPSQQPTTKSSFTTLNALGINNNNSNSQFSTFQQIVPGQLLSGNIHSNNMDSNHQIQSNQNTYNLASKDQQTQQLPQQNQQMNQKDGRSLLPPRVAHKRQSSYGGSGSGANINAYLVNIASGATNNLNGIGAAVEEGDQAKQIEQAHNLSQQTCSGGIFNKMFGSSFAKTGINGAPQTVSNKDQKAIVATDSDQFSAIPHSAAAFGSAGNAAAGSFSSYEKFPLGQQQYPVFQTFDNTRFSNRSTTVVTGTTQSNHHQQQQQQQQYFNSNENNNNIKNVPKTKLTSKISK